MLRPALAGRSGRKGAPSMVGWRYPLIAGLGWAAGLIGSPAPATATDPNPYVSYGWSVFLPYVNAPAGDADITLSPRLRISLGGSSHEAILDTGSTGVVVSASDIPGV